MMQSEWIVAIVVSAVLALSGGATGQISSVTPLAPVAPVAAPPTSGAPPPATTSNPNITVDATGNDDPNQIICVKEKPTGSLIPLTVCETWRFWIKRGDDSRVSLATFKTTG